MRYSRRHGKKGERDNGGRGRGIIRDGVVKRYSRWRGEKEERNDRRKTTISNRRDSLKRENQQKERKRKRCTSKSRRLEANDMAPQKRDWLDLCLCVFACTCADDVCIVRVSMRVASWELCLRVSVCFDVEGERGITAELRLRLKRETEKESVSD